VANPYHRCVRVQVCARGCVDTVDAALHVIHAEFVHFCFCACVRGCACDCVCGCLCGCLCGFVRGRLCVSACVMWECVLCVDVKGGTHTETLASEDSWRSAVAGLLKVSVCVHAYVRACACVCMRACGRAYVCVRACVRARAYVRVRAFKFVYKRMYM